MMKSVIQIENLTKVYGQGKNAFKALDQLNLKVNQGEIFGYLGPNGAGKTTTIRMMLDLIRPTEGKITLLDQDAQHDSVQLRKRIGFLPGELSLWDSERSDKIIAYFARIRGMTDTRYAQDLAERLQFDTTKRVRDYSTGNKRKLGLILALMHKPELLILDEPTSGLDPLMQQTFNQLMIEAKNEGHTIFLSSHVLSEVQSICDRVAVLRHGELKAVERVDALTQVDFRWVTMTTRDAVTAGSWISAVDGVTEVTQKDDHTLHLRLMGDFDPLLKALSDKYVVELHVKEPTLEEIFLAFYDDNSPLQTQLNGKLNGMNTVGKESVQ
ncbi:MAG: ABC transporter ATP-binding protein [Aggregatilineales bacterium]